MRRCSPVRASQPNLFLREGTFRYSVPAVVLERVVVLPVEALVADQQQRLAQLGSLWPELAERVESAAELADPD